MPWFDEMHESAIMLGAWFVVAVSMASIGISRLRETMSWSELRAWFLHGGEDDASRPYKLSSTGARDFVLAGSTLALGLLGLLLLSSDERVTMRAGTALHCVLVGMLLARWVAFQWSRPAGLATGRGHLIRVSLVLVLTVVVMFVSGALIVGALLHRSG